MKKIIFFLFFTALITSSCFAQTHTLTGYWQNWNDGSNPYIPLGNIDSAYSVIEVSFATPVGGTTFNMTFTPDGVSSAAFIAKVDSLRNKGKKVVISIGGANDPVILNDTTQRNLFINSLFSIITTYHFDGIDIDLEGISVTISGGTITAPVDAKIINLISGIKSLMTKYRVQYNKKMYLTMAPETAYVEGGMSAFGGIWGAYLPILHSLRDSIDILQVQFYNSGSMYGLDGRIYNQGTADFIISQTDALIKGFNTAGGFFTGFRQDQISVGLPACSGAAGGGYIIPDSVKAAIKYLRGLGPKPGTYSLTSLYPNLRGMMTWSVNWDANSGCHSVYEFARTYGSIFTPLTGFNNNNNNTVTGYRLYQNYPNPFNPATKIKFSLSTGSFTKLIIVDEMGREVLKLVNENLSAGSYEYSMNGSYLASGTYFYVLNTGEHSETKKMMLVK